MSATPIEWTDFSVNPIRARLRNGATLTAGGKTVGGYGSGVGHYCEKISPGCANCYASTSQPRFAMPEFPGARRSLPTLPAIAANGAVPVSDAVEVFFDESRLREVLQRKKPTKWFWFDQTDALGSWVPFEWLDRCFAVMALTPHHTHQILTKRPERMAEYLEPDRESRIGKAAFGIAETSGIDWDVFWRKRDFGYPDEPPRWPLKNVWLGTSAEDQTTYDARREHLMACPAAVRFLSLEPLLGPVEIPLYPDRASIRWVIAGGESGPDARPMDRIWVRSIRDQCRVANVPFFFKQWGSWRPADKVTKTRIEVRFRKDDPAGPRNPEWHEWPDGWKSARVGKKAAGRLLDGRTWDEFPARAAEVSRV